MEKFTTLTGVAAPLPMANVDTDKIIPARFLKTIKRTGLGVHLFDTLRFDPEGRERPDFVLNREPYRHAVIIVAHENFGCGSSREHAPQAIRRRGIQAVIGQSFSEIFFGNAVVLGMPCPTASAETVNALMTAVERDPTTEIGVDLSAMRVTANGRAYDLSLPPAAREAFLDGSWDATGLLLERYEQVEAVAARLPYVSGNW